MVFDIVVCILTIFLFLIGIVYKKILLSIVASILTIFSFSSILLFYIFSIKYLINVKIYVYSFLIAFILIVILYSFIPLRVIKIIFTVIVLIISTSVCIISKSLIGIKYKTYNGKEYVGIYDNITAICETIVTYFEIKAPLLVSSDYSFSENYGIILGGEDKIFEREPYEIKFNPSFTE